MSEMETSILNEHNKAEYPPMHIGGFDTSLKNVNTLECVYQFVRLFLFCCISLIFVIYLYPVF